MNLNDAELKVFLDLMEMVSQDLSNSGCNDYDLKDTPENRALVKAADLHFCGEEFEVTARDGKIRANDGNLLDYIVHRIKEAHTKA